MEILERERVKYWHEILLEIANGEAKPFSWSDEKAIRTAISYKIKNDHPDAKFKTKAAEKDVDGEIVKYLEVERIS